MTPQTALRVAASNRKLDTELRLTVTYKGERLEQHTLRGGRTIIGRDPHAGICIHSRYISWKHAEIKFEAGGPVLVDLNSRNKTLVNAEEILREILHDGDIISIGYHRIHVRVFRILVTTADECSDDGPSLRSPLRSAATTSQEPDGATDSPESAAGRVDMAADAFRTYAENFARDPDMIAADIDTIAIDEDAIGDPSNEFRVAELAPGIDLPELICGDHDEGNTASLQRQEVELAIAETTGEAGTAVTELFEQFEGREEQLVAVLGQLFDYPVFSAHELMQCIPDLDRLGLSEARARRCLLVSSDNKPTAVIADPFDEHVRPWLEARIADDLQWVLVSPGNLNAFLSRHEQSIRAMDSVVQSNSNNVDPGSDIDDLSFASISQDSSPIVKLVHSTLYDALRAGASDVHMEAGSAAMEIRYRIDGVLAHVATVNGADVAEQVISRLKVMSELDIAERRVPQDGRFKSSYEGRPIDFRVSIMPSSFGEDAVLRVLDKQAVTDQLSALSLDSLGFTDSIVKSLRRLSERPYGMLLVTGPTGSGKTTTLYGAISETNSGLGKIVTIEDPVEYQLAGVLQIPVNEKKGLTFARGLRSILRHDPDKIMVGEIRDPETAQIAIQSALTGHLVFTTVHANNVFDVLSRFLHMGVDAYSFVSALNGILAQRLLRIICQNCGEDIEATKTMLEATGQPLEVARQYHWRAGTGCSECRGTGYRGRKAVGELLVLDDELREAIIGRAPVRQLKEMAAASGVQFIRDSALALVRDGLTTMEEVDRVTTMA